MVSQSKVGRYTANWMVYRLAGFRAELSIGAAPQTQVQAGRQSVQAIIEQRTCLVGHWQLFEGHFPPERSGTHKLKTPPVFPTRIEAQGLHSFEPSRRLRIYGRVLAALLEEAWRNYLIEG